jgi:hypothetical protein
MTRYHPTKHQSVGKVPTLNDISDEFGPISPGSLKNFPDESKLAVPGFGDTSLRQAGSVS